MNDLLFEKINRWTEENLAPDPEPLLVTGVSGGADSICLLHILTELQKKKPLLVMAVHVNHMLRGEESLGDEQFVQEICREWQVPLKVFRRDVLSFSHQNNCSVEEAGRILRYDCFQQVLREEKAQYIAVAHHRQDQAETIFLNLLRGSGLDGLCGMEAVSGKIIRPLLNVDKEEIEAYLERNHLKYRTDSSNLDNTYSRNLLRNSIFPQLEAKTGRSPVASVLRMASRLKSDRDFLNALSQEQYCTVVLAEEDGKVVLNRKELMHLHRAIAGRVIRLAWERVTGSHKGLESKHVDTVLEAASRKKTGKTLELPNRIRLRMDYNHLSLFEEKKEGKKERPVHIALPVPANVQLPGEETVIRTGLYTREEYIEVFGEVKKPCETSLKQIFDYDRISKGINIRNRLPGDVIFPYRSPGRKKLKAYFIDEKTPGPARDDILLVAEEKDILWVIGRRTSESYSVTQATRNILYIEVMREQPSR